MNGVTATREPTVNTPLASTTRGATESSVPGPPPPPGFDRFGSSSLVRFWETAEQPLLGSFRIEDAEGRFLGSLRRDGMGWRVVQMNFALDNPEGRAVYRIRSTPPPSGIGFGTPFALQDPFGTTVGQLRWNLPQQASLQRSSGPSYRARVPGWGGRFPIEAPGRILAEAVYLRPRFLFPPVRPPGFQLSFTPACGGPAERSLLVAFAAFIVSMARPGREGMAAAAPV